MELVIGAAVVAAGLVVSALLLGRSRHARPAPAGIGGVGAGPLARKPLSAPAASTPGTLATVNPDPKPAVPNTALDVTLARRLDELDRREGELREREALLASAHVELEERRSE